MSVDANEGIDRVAKLMAQDGTRRVLVTKDGKLLGVIRVQTILACMRDYIDSISAQIARVSSRFSDRPAFGLRGEDKREASRSRTFGTRV